MDKFYSSWISIVAAYLITLGLLGIGIVLRATWPLGVAILMFTIWDVLWVAFVKADRTAQETVESAGRARTYMSYFVAVYGTGLIYFLLHVQDNQEKQMLSILKSSQVPIWLLLTPLVLSAVSMLFFPIRLGENLINESLPGSLANKNPTRANRVVLAITAWSEKVATFCFVYAVAMIVAFLIHSGKTPNQP